MSSVVEVVVMCRRIRGGVMHAAPLDVLRSTWISVMLMLVNCKGSDEVPIQESVSIDPMEILSRREPEVNTFRVVVHTIVRGVINRPDGTKAAALRLRYP